MSLLLLLQLALAAPPSSTQATSASPTRVLLNQATPLWPEEASADEHGTVRVRVRVGPDGVVTGAAPIDGPEVFHASAVAAALTLRFEPAGHEEPAPDEEAVVRFHFAPPAHLDHDAMLDTIVVHGESADHEDTRARTTLDSAALDRAAGEDLGATLSAVPGVTTAGGSSDTSKPLIRGYSERRLLVLFDGIRHESQKWGADHGTEIDTFAAGEISVIRGAAGARYGPDALGGVVLVAPPPMRHAVGVGGAARLGFASNGLRPHAALRMDVVPARAERLSLRAQGNVAKGSSLSAPSYVLGNTASELWNVGAAVAYRFDAGVVRVTAHHYDLDAGIYYGSQLGTPAALDAALQGARPPGSEGWTRTYRIDDPRQAVTHDVVAAHAAVSGSAGALEVTLSTQRNHRQEFEASRESVQAAQYNFDLRSHAVDALYRQPSRGLPVGSLEGGAGMQLMLQDNLYAGVPLLPNFRGLSAGLFAFERLALPRVDVEVGGRLDGLARTAYFTTSDFQRQLRAGNLGPSSCTVTDTAASCASRYPTGSLSAGALVHVLPEQLDVKLDVSSASRFPSVDELYLLGAAPSAPVFAVGDPSLGVERSLGASLTGGLRSRWLTLEVSGFGSRGRNRTLFAPLLDPDGTPVTEVTIRGTWPKYTTTAIDAVQYGADGQAEIGAAGPVGLIVRGATVRAQRSTDGQHLLGMPADRVGAELIARLPPLERLFDVEAAVTVDHLAEQDRANAIDLAPAPPAATLLGARVDATLTVHGQELLLGMTAQNLLNTSYRDVVSLLRFTADQPGRDVRVRVGADF